MTNGLDFDEFMESLYVQMMNAVPELPMLMGVLQVGATPCPLDRFSFVSDEAVADRQRLLANIARRLADFPRDSMSAAQLLTADVLDYFLNFSVEGPWIGLRGGEFAAHSYLVNPGHGEPGRLLDALTQQHPFRHEQDAEDYVRRAEGLGEAIAHVGRQVALRARRGILLPAPLLHRSVEELRGFIALAPDANPIERTFAAKSALIRDLSVQRRQALFAALQEAMRKRVLPSYVTLEALLTAHLEGASQDPGLWRLPDGEAYYEFLLRSATTTDLSAGEVHALGLDHVARLQGEIGRALVAAGLPNTDPIESLRQLEAQTRFAPSTPRSTVLQRCRSILNEIRDAASGLFHALPEAEIIMEPVPPFSEDVRHTVYLPSAADGSRPACMVINLKEVAAESELDLPTLLYHELFPGHHLQFSYAQQLKGLPTFRRAVTFDAYIEGWAKYAETIPWEHQFNRDPRWHAMRLRRELLSTANLVLDTGIHTKRWTLDEAADYLQSTTGCSDAMSRSIALRSASLPAQLCSYKIGMLQVTELKSQFRRVRGAAYDVRDFHAAILDNGALPLRVLKTVMDSAAHAVPAARGGTPDSRPAGPLHRDTQSGVQIGQEIVGAQRG
jgi:uncharacterized protein (DUF885 family)